MSQKIFTCDPIAGLVFKRDGQPVTTRDRSGYVYARSRLATRSKAAHRIIWESVNGPIPDGLVINHKNGVKDDNRIQNLEICTQAENVEHAYLTGLANNSGSRNGRSKLTEDQAAEIKSATGSQRKIAKRFGVSQSQVSLIKSGRCWGWLK